MDHDPRTALLELGRALSARGWTPATSGNLSARAPGGCWVTTSGLDKGALTLDDLVLVNAFCRALGARRPSAEAQLHAQIYAAMPQAGVVVHVHSRASTVISRLVQADALVLQGYEILKALAGVSTHERAVRVPVVANSQDVAAIAREVEARLSEPDLGPAYLIRGHGLYTWGANAAEALRHADALDFLFSCELETWRIRP